MPDLSNPLVLGALALAGLIFGSKFVTLDMVKGWLREASPSPKTNPDQEVDHIDNYANLIAHLGENGQPTSAKTLADMFPEIYSACRAACQHEEQENAS